MDIDYIRRVILDTDEKLMRVGESDHEYEFPKTADTYDRLLSDLMCRLIEHLDIGNTENYWHSSADCTWPILPEFVKDE